jgi:hypothetical protein
MQRRSCCDRLTVWQGVGESAVVNPSHTRLCTDRWGLAPGRSNFSVGRSEGFTLTTYLSLIGCIIQSFSNDGSCFRVLDDLHNYWVEIILFIPRLSACYNIEVQLF